MKAKIVRIGNSRGVRIPKAVLASCGLGEVVELRETKNGLLLSPVAGARAGWDESFRTAIGQPDPASDLRERAATDFDRADWEW